MADTDTKRKATLADVPAILKESFKHLEEQLNRAPTPKEKEAIVKDVTHDVMEGTLYIDKVKPEDKSQPSVEQKAEPGHRKGINDHYQHSVDKFIQTNLRTPTPEEIKDIIVPDAVKASRDARAATGEENSKSPPILIEKEVEEFMLKEGRRPTQEEKKGIIKEAVSKAFESPKSAMGGKENTDAQALAKNSDQLSEIAEKLSSHNASVSNSDQSHEHNFKPQADLAQLQKSGGLGLQT